MKGAGKNPPFSFFITIYCMKLILKEVNLALSADSFSPQRYGATGMEEESCGCTCPTCHKEIDPNEDGEIEGDELEITPQILAGLLGAGTKLVVVEKKKKKKRDRCTSMAARKFDPFPSYNAAAAISRCRKGEIWKKKK